MRRRAGWQVPEQDPRLGVISLSEIGSRAFSPSTNDPGTAIEVIAALQRVFARVLTEKPTGRIDFPHLHLRATSLDDLITDALRPLARDGAALLEVQIRLQKCLASLARLAPSSAPTFRSAADQATERAGAALNPPDSRALNDACVSEDW